MGMLALGLPSLALAVILMMLVEVRQYRAGRRLISRRRFVLRLLAGGLLVGILAAVFCGIFCLGLREPGDRPLHFLAYWCGCLVLGIFLMVIMFADMKEVEAVETKRQHQMWREVARLMVANWRGRGGGQEKTTGGDGNSCDA